jgi:hypothetical protein
LRQNVGIIKAETDVDVPSEEDSISMKTDEVHIPTAYKPEVSHVADFVCLCMHFY